MSESYPAALGPDRAMRRRDARAFWRAAAWAFAAVALLAWIKALEFLFDKPLDGLGIVPGTAMGLIGVLTAPLVHGSVEHLISNSFPLLVLGTLARYAYPRALNRALPLIWILSGIGTWLIGRPPAHVGASGITEGLLFFVFMLGVLRRDRRSIAIAPPGPRWPAASPRWRRRFRRPWWVRWPSACWRASAPFGPAPSRR